MGSSTLIDYALFQLTPTRTRCDLVLFYGGKTEKLASGLFDPFVSHLKFAKDQISRGGYSIRLCPPTTYAPWFTKATFERFVRFVSTPAVLERFVSLEKEILQIESSAQANELSNTNVTGRLEEGSGLASNSNPRKSRDSPKIKGEVDRCDDAAPEGNSKIQLQHLLEARKKMLRKEQAMAYARGIVAGFEMDNIDDLISFADAFGASRLREACINFKELCKKKRGDGLWMEELAAMEACPPSELTFLGTSGIVLNNDPNALNPNITLNLHKDGSTIDLASNGYSDASRSGSITSQASPDSKKDDNLATSNQMPSNNSKMQVPMTWPNHMPHYLYNFQNPFQQLPPYQGYPFPIPPQYAMNMQWSPSLKESGPTKKEKSLNKKVSENSREDEGTESTNSEEESDSDLYMLPDKGNSSTDSSHGKKHRKKSSKMVVIRNINYITPKGRNGEKAGVSDDSSDAADFIDEDSLRQQVDDAVESLEKSHKSKSRNHKKKSSHKSNSVSNGSYETTGQDDPAEGTKKNKNWDAFQNLLMRNEESTVNGVEKLHPMDTRDEHYTVRGSGDGTASETFPSLDLESEKVPKQRTATNDSFVVTHRNGGYEERNGLEDIENAENLTSLVKRRDYMDSDLVIPQRLEELGSGNKGMLATESRIIKPGKGEDWFVISHSGQPENQNSTNEDVIFTSDGLSVEKSRRDIVVDDSFMVHARPAVDDLYDSQWKTDISMDADLTSKLENSAVKDSWDTLGAHEPDDLCVVLERDSGFISARESWTEGHGIDISYMETDRRSSNGETNTGMDKKLTADSDSTVAKKEETKGRKVLGKDVKSKVLPAQPRHSTTNMVSKSRKPSLASRTSAQQSKQQKEEEIRKKMEELLIQRQKRIAERTAAAGFVPAATKQAKGVPKFDKNRTPSMINRQTRQVP